MRSADDWRSTTNDTATGSDGEQSTSLCFVGGVSGTLLALVALQLGGIAIGAEGATIAFRPRKPKHYRFVSIISSRWHRRRNGARDSSGNDTNC